MYYGINKCNAVSIYEETASEGYDGRENMIVLENASKIYKGDTYETYALNNVSIKINDGEFVAVKGRSGSGKSTLLNILGCMDKLTSGRYILDDVNVSNLNPYKFDKLRKQKISFIFQRYELLNRYTVYENIELPLTVQGLSVKEKKSKIYDIMERLEITGLKGKYPRQISGGEQQRVSIARAYVSGKKYLLADEPTGALDEKNTERIMEILKELHGEGRTIILVTHDNIVAEYAERSLTISDGIIEA